MRIAILLTSNDKSEFADRYPNDGEKFITLLRPLRPDWQYKVYPAMDGVFPDALGDYDGFIITGSPASVHDREPWVATLLVLIREIHEARIPLIGACFGHQAIALALGGKVGKNPQGWEMGTSVTRFERQLWMDPPHDSLTLYSAHKEQVLGLPVEAITIGASKGCPVAAFVIGEHIMTTEYHPEMPADFMKELVNQMSEALTPEQAELAREQISAGQDGAIFAKWMINFLEMPRD